MLDAYVFACICQGVCVLIYIYVAARSCDVLNGECDHLCFEDIFNQTNCKCLPGYVLEANGVSCTSR